MRAPLVGVTAKQNDQWITVWQTNPLKILFVPLPLVGDFDGDGTQEIAILPFYQLKLIDARTGQTKDSCRFNDNRSYGFQAFMTSRVMASGSFSSKRTSRNTSMYLATGMAN